MGSPLFTPENKNRQPRLAVISWDGWFDGHTPCQPAVAGAAPRELPRHSGDDINIDIQCPVTIAIILSHLCPKAPPAE